LDPRLAVASAKASVLLSEPESVWDRHRLGLGRATVSVQQVPGDQLAAVLGQGGHVFPVARPAQL
jgi:hypothetical protein